MSFLEFRKAANRFTPREIGFLILAVIVLALVAVGLAVGNYYLADTLPGGDEFYLLRTAGRSYLFNQVEPYSGTVSARVQEQVYGRAAQPGEDRYLLDVPFHLLMFFFPLALFPDALTARAFWMAFTQIFLVLFIYLGFRFLDRQTPFLFGALIFVGSFTSFYAYLTLTAGSPVILLGFAYLGILLSLRSGLDELAGALIVVSSYYWEIGAPILLFILFVVFKKRRWRVFAGAGMLAFILLAISLFLYPGWIVPFLQNSWSNIRSGFGFSILEVLSRVWPEYGRFLGWALVAGLVVALGYEWSAAWKANRQRFIWAACFTLASTPLLGFRIVLDQLVILTIPLMLVVILARERWRRIGSGLAILLIIFFFGVPWYLYTQGLPWQIELSADEIFFLFWPVFGVIGLYWVRWWMIRPPRTWLDHAIQQTR